jgi:hypothetical protein
MFNTATIAPYQFIQLEENRFNVRRMGGLLLPTFGQRNIRFFSLCRTAYRLSPFISIARQAYIGELGGPRWLATPKISPESRFREPTARYSKTADAISVKILF